MKTLHMMTLVGVLAVALLAPSVAHAHGFGDRYDLPVPLNLYIIGAGATVLFSFGIIGLFAKGAGGHSYPRYNLLRSPVGRALAHPWALAAVKTAAVLLFLMYIFAGLFGTSDPSRNLVPTMTWIVFWVGIAYFSAFVGNIWALINPWKILFGWAEGAYRRWSGGRSLARNNEYPEELGAWPAVALFVVFAWLENVYPDSAVPFSMTLFVLAYSGLTFAGMFWYGRDTWLKNGEAFSLALGFLASLAPTEVRVRGQARTEARGPRLRAAGRLEHGRVVVTQERHGTPPQDLVDDYEAYAQAPPDRREWNVRPWAAGLLSARGPSFSHMVFLLVMLSTVTFDGFAETPLWAQMLTSGYNAVSGVLGFQAFTALKTVGLLVFPFLFIGAFAVTAFLMGRMARSDMGVPDLMQAFVYSLVPIALAYHVAHFFSFLFTQGQRMISLASDPFGWGWDLFGTAGYTLNIGVVNAQAAWIVGVAAIVIGHIVAVYAAHVYAMRLFPPAAALRSQYPMMALMVAYTMVSLWIIAQPIVELG